MPTAQGQGDKENSAKELEMSVHWGEGHQARMQRKCVQRKGDGQLYQMLAGAQEGEH